MAEHDETPSQPYTVHQDADPEPSRRGGADPVALVAGVVSLVIAVLALTGRLAVIDPRWVLALGALLVGGTLLLVTLRHRRT